MSDYQLWWDDEVEEGKRHEPLFEHVRAIDWDQHDQRERMLQHACLYDPHAMLLSHDGYYTEPDEDTNVGPITTNVVKSAVDTATAKIARVQTRPAFTTSGASWKVQRRAKKLERWVQGEFYRTKFYRKSIAVFRDATVLGIGALKVFPENGRVCCERTIPDELIVDEQECRAAPPRHLYQKKWVDVGVLIAEFPDFKDQILEALENAPSPRRRRARNRQIPVIEGWHLRSGEDQDDGRHVICIDGADLLDEKYDKDYFPFVFYRWADRLTGFQGYPLTEELVGLQLRINKLNRFIARCQDLMLIPRVFVPHVDFPHMKATMKTEIGQIIPMRGGKPPVFATPPAIAPEVYSDLEAQIRRAYELPGVSQAAATAQKPAGIDSAVGMREVKDLTTERFAIQEQQWEEFTIDATVLFIAVQKDIGDPDAKTRARRRRAGAGFDELRWADVDLDLADVGIEIRAASILSLSPAARKQTVLEWLQWGLIDSDQGKRLFDHPDLESELSLISSSIEDLDETFERLLDGVWDPPEGVQNLGRGIARCQQKYLEVRHSAPAEVKQLLRDWMELAKRENDKAIAEAAKMGAAAGGVGAAPPAGQAVVAGAPAQPAPVPT